ncbi:HAD-IA family hydrolase [Kitasatospora aureofaciens]|uniref:HAD family hydrolase n=1 Tax=Kitasatospora aureofaciens TaxID=1894 RepID=UPI0033EDDAB5
MDVLATRPRAILCDVDGVVRHRDTTLAKTIEDDHGLPNGSIAKAALAPDLLQQAVTGRLDEHEWLSQATDRLAEVPAARQRAAAALAEWARPLGTVDHTVLGMLATVAQTVPVALLSNGTTRLESDLQDLGVTNVLGTLINSARIGHAKPSEEIYRAAAERLGVPLDQCLLIDDTQSYVDGARRIGMPAVLYSGHESLRRVLAAVPNPEKAGGAHS